MSETAVLDQDASVRGQKYALISFVSPEDVILRKDVYMFGKYLTQFAADITTMFDNIKSFPAFSEDKTIQAMISSVIERHASVFHSEDLAVDLGFFKLQQGEALESEYLRENGYQTSMRGFKIRGAYETLPEAKIRAEALARIDKHFDIFVCEVGCWSPWSPDPNEIAESEFRDTRLNTLIKKYKEAGELRDTVFEDRKESMMKGNDISVEAVEFPDAA